MKNEKEIVGNDVKFKDNIKVKFMGVAIVVQDFLFVYKRNQRYSYYGDNETFTSSWFHNYDKFVGFQKDEKLMEKPIYHCYLLVETSLLKPIVIWSNSYTTKRSVLEMLDICNNSSKALLKKSSGRKTTVMANVLADFKMKYGSDTIPIRIVDGDFAVKKGLPAFSIDGHKNKPMYL